MEKAIRFEFDDNYVSFWINEHDHAMGTERLCGVSVGEVVGDHGYSVSMQKEDLIEALETALNFIKGK